MHALNIVIIITRLHAYNPTAKPTNSPGDSDNEVLEEEVDPSAEAISMGQVQRLHPAVDKLVEQVRARAARWGRRARHYASTGRPARRGVAPVRGCAGRGLTVA